MSSWSPSTRESRRIGLRRGLSVIIIVLSASLASACAETPGPQRVRARDNALITSQELIGLNVGNAYDAVLQLRPMWLASRGRRSSRLPTEIVVAQNGSYFGPVSALRGFEIATIRQLRYLDSSQAGTLTGLGSRHVEGAIVVELR